MDVIEMTDISEVNLERKHVIVKTKKSLNLDIPDRVFYCKSGFGCDPKTSGTKIYGSFLTDTEEVFIRRASVERLATDDEIKQANERCRQKVIDERCTCGHFKSRHAGLNGHGACKEEDCPCNQFTWAEWIIIKELKKPDDVIGLHETLENVFGE